MTDYFFFCMDCGGKMCKVGNSLENELCNKCYREALIEMKDERGLFSFDTLRESGLMFGEEWDCEIEKHEIKGMEVSLFA